jgi:hypothetical protein
MGGGSRRSAGDRCVVHPHGVLQSVLPRHCQATSAVCDADVIYTMKLRSVDTFLALQVVTTAVLVESDSPGRGCTSTNVLQSC